MADLDAKGKDLKDLKDEPAAPPPPMVVEVIVRPLSDIGHTFNLAAKVKMPDGSILDHAVESNGPAKELRLELADLQEVAIRAKVTNLVVYDHAQSAVVSAPPPPPDTKKVADKEDQDERKVQAPPPKSQSSQHASHR